MKFLRSVTKLEDADDLFLFPASMQSMRMPLQIYFDTLFKQSAYHESYLFRGIYFCGEAAVETLPQALAHAQSIEQSLAGSQNAAGVRSIQRHKPNLYSCPISSSRRFLPNRAWPNQLAK